jgi:hypothetical protein
VSLNENGASHHPRGTLTLTSGALPFVPAGAAAVATLGSNEIEIQHMISVLAAFRWKTDQRHFRGMRRT